MNLLGALENANGNSWQERKYNTNLKGTTTIPHGNKETSKTS